MHRANLDHSPLRDMDQERTKKVPGKKFFVHLAGNTNGAHEAIVKKVKDVQNIRVDSPAESDYLLVFCPISSRVGTDISEALESIPDDIPIILVVMHLTFDPNKVVAESRRQVENRNVVLTVDTLFDQNGLLLNCFRNNDAVLEIQRVLPLPPPSLWYCITNYLNHNWKAAAVLTVALVVLVITLTVVIVRREKRN